MTVAATGTCSRCTALEIANDKGVQIPAPSKKVECQMTKRSIVGAMCRSIQGQEGCRGCAAQSRLCESCGSRPVRFPQYGFCFTCSVKELGDGWQADEPDRPVAHPHLRVVSTDVEVTEKEKGREITLLAQEFRRIPLANIRDPSHPVRSSKPDGQDLMDLGDSMLNDRMIYPVVLEPVSENFYEVVIGSRRVLAARLQEQLDIPAFIWEPRSPLVKLILMLAENIHRVQLDPFEEAKMFLRLMREFGLSLFEVSTKINKPGSYVKERLQLLSVSEETQQLVAKGALSVGNAAVLARLPEERQGTLARESIKHRLSESELRRRVNTEAGTEQESARVLPYHVTPEKLAASVDEFSRWFRRATPRIKLEGATLEDQTLMLGALAGLENRIQKVKALIKKHKPSSRKKAQ